LRRAPGWSVNRRFARHAISADAYTWFLSQSHLNGVANLAVEDEAGTITNAPFRFLQADCVPLRFRV
jgi:hypothetical protein